MRTEQERTITLSEELADLLDEKLASDAFSSEQEVLTAGLLALDEETSGSDIDEETLRREVLPVIDAMRRDPSRGIPLAEARAHMAERHRHYKRQPDGQHAILRARPAMFCDPSVTITRVRHRFLFFHRYTPA